MCCAGHLQLNDAGKYHQDRTRREEPGHQILSAASRKCVCSQLHFAFGYNCLGVGALLLARDLLLSVDFSASPTLKRLHLLGIAGWRGVFSMRIIVWSEQEQLGIEPPKPTVCLDICRARNRVLSIHVRTHRVEYVKS